MDVTILTDSTTEYLLPVNFIFWGFVFVYILHILEESIFPEAFVEKVKRLYFPEYNWLTFSCFNTFLLILNISAIIIFEGKGGAWIIFPLSMATERIFNGFYHLAETLISKKFSSGLLTSVISWILGYMIIRYSLIKGEILINHFVISVIIGVLIFSLMIFPLITGNLRKGYLLLEKLKKRCVSNKN
ncbi:MAG: HXXEE domain-containing protein [Firmicutes bacterium]|nr:HXXEE domain-containing protein [Bacillota bacterium]